MLRVLAILAGAAVGVSVIVLLLRRRADKNDTTVVSLSGARPGMFVIRSGGTRDSAQADATSTGTPTTPNDGDVDASTPHQNGRHTIM